MSGPVRVEKPKSRKPGSEYVYNGEEPADLTEDEIGARNRLIEEITSLKFDVRENLPKKNLEETKGSELFVDKAGFLKPQFIKEITPTPMDRINEILPTIYDAYHNLHQFDFENCLATKTELNIQTKNKMIDQFRAEIEAKPLSSTAASSTPPRPIPIPFGATDAYYERYKSDVDLSMAKDLKKKIITLENEIDQLRTVLDQRLLSSPADHKPAPSQEGSVSKKRKLPPSIPETTILPNLTTTLSAGQQNTNISSTRPTPTPPGRHQNTNTSSTRLTPTPPTGQKNTSNSSTQEYRERYLAAKGNVLTNVSDKPMEGPQFNIKLGH